MTEIRKRKVRKKEKKQDVVISNSRAQEPSVVVACSDDGVMSNKTHTLTKGDVAGPGFIKQLKGHDEKSIWHTEDGLECQKLLE